jgi:hypothetical protein
MSAQDYRINAEVRRHLVSRWVDIQHLQLGTTNGVVYILGDLDTRLEDPRRRLDEGAERSATERVVRLAMRLEREIRGIRDVRDVVFKFNNLYKRGGRWRIVGHEESVVVPGSTRRSPPSEELREESPS